MPCSSSLHTAARLGWPTCLAPSPRPALDCQGKISDLRERAEQVFSETGYSKQQVYTHHVGIGHTRWATHGAPCSL